MKHFFADIVDRIPDPPKWFDENGTPRYNDFGPDEVPDIYAAECCLLQITCQNCRRPFDVGFSWYKYADERRLTERVEDNSIHYGDPPNMGCCDAGVTMNSVPRQVLQFWRREGADWRRVPELERVIDCGWDDEEMDPGR